MSSYQNHQSGKASPCEVREASQNEHFPSLQDIQPVLVSEGSDESDGGGAPLWTPASTSFSKFKAYGVSSKSADQDESPMEINEIRARHEGLSPVSYRTKSKRMNSAASECPPRQESNDAEPKQERKLIRHRHTVGSSQVLESSLNALTAPFIPSTAQGSYSLEIGQGSGNGQGGARDGNARRTPFGHRPGSKSLHAIDLNGDNDVPPFPFTKRPPVPGLHEMLSSTQRSAQRTSQVSPSRWEPSSYTNDQVDKTTQMTTGAERVPHNTDQAMVPSSQSDHIEEHRLRIFATPSEQIRKGRSDALNWLIARGVPQEKNLLDPHYIPFMESAREHSPVDHAVVHFSNIPYSVSGDEIMALVGRISRHVVDGLDGVHIIMTRIDGKTHDAFVEFENLNAAMSVVSRLEHRGNGRNAGSFGSSNTSSHATRLGERQVSVALSSQKDLMKALFPNARGVEWQGVHPQFPAQPMDQPWKHFKGFLTMEELSMLVKHVEFPQRASFSSNCPERPYENFMSVLKKFPWNETKYITIHMQQTMYDTARRLIEILQDKIDREDSQRLTETLLTRLVTACLLCPGFTVLQKDNIMVVADWSYANVSFPLNMPRFADHWCHQYALCPRPGAPHDVVEFYIGIIREETKSRVSTFTLEESRELAAKALTTSDYWGYFWLEVGFPQPGKPNTNEYGCRQNFDSLSLFEVAQLEWAAIDRILRRALQPKVTAA